MRDPFVECKPCLPYSYFITILIFTFLIHFIAYIHAAKNAYHEAKLINMAHRILLCINLQDFYKAHCMKTYVHPKIISVSKCVQPVPDKHVFY